jgi:hypothetical protein
MMKSLPSYWVIVYELFRAKKCIVRASVFSFWVVISFSFWKMELRELSPKYKIYFIYYSQYIVWKYENNNEYFPKPKIVKVCRNGLSILAVDGITYKEKLT